MSSIYHFGYGYSKIICEDVTSWFLNEYFGVVGYCDVIGGYYRPRHFMIELQAHMDKEMYIKTLFHELTHMAQWVGGSLRFHDGKMCYSHEPVENYDYEDQPHEIEAREEEERLYDLWLNVIKGVPMPEVSQ
jgi:hypothetical protein